MKTGVCGALILATTATAVCGESASSKEVACAAGNAADSGLLVLSADLPDPPHRGPQRIFFEYAPADGSLFSEKKMTTDRSRGFYKAVPSDFTGLFGRLYAIQLKPGTYAFTGWTAIDGPIKHWSTGKLPFVITAGRATSVGSFPTELLSVLTQEIAGT